MVEFMKKKILLAIFISSILLLTASSAVPVSTTLDGENKIFLKKIYMDEAKGYIERYPKLEEKFPLIFTPAEWVKGFYPHLRIVVDSGVVKIGNILIETPCTIRVLLFKGEYYMWDKIDDPTVNPDGKEGLSVDAFGAVFLVS
jgi:hypothetical protein